MRILVAGATGFIGSHVTREALRAGHRVVSLSRGTRQVRHPRGVQVVQVDLVRPHGLEHALRRVEAVVHAAGILREGAGQSFERVHVGGTANLLDACKAAGVRKVVYLSTLGAQIHSPNPYLRTKAEAERLVEASGLAYTIFRPAVVFGTGDRLVSHLQRLIRLLGAPPSPVPKERRSQPVWVGDVATAVVRALTDRTTDGHVYELGGPEALTYAELVETIRRRMGRSWFRLPLPGLLLQPFSRLGELLLDHPLLTTDQLELLAAGGTCDPSPAAVTFGLRMRPLADVLRELEAARRRATRRG